MKVQKNKKHKIGIFGTGTVGGGVIEILEKKFSNEIEIVKICTKKIDERCNALLSKNTKFVQSFDEILDDTEIETVVELIGGTTIAWEIVKKALLNGKNVVTANKALIAKFLPEIEEILKKNPQLKFGFEASVGGGIPIINTLQNNFSVDNISKISGILNGTTNFILSKMELENAKYSEALLEAQKLGYAEADPIADVGGFDVRAKIAILIKLAFGLTINEEEIIPIGIERIMDIDFVYASQLNSTIKLLAVAEKRKEKELLIYISPVMISLENNLAKISGATNAVMIESENLQKSILVGEGAGRFPTASAVVFDIINIAQDFCKLAFAKQENYLVVDDFNSQFYVRFKIYNKVGVLKKIGEAAEKNGISINSILQSPIKGEILPFVLTTEECSKKAVENMCADIASEKFCIEKPFSIPWIIND